MKIITFRDIINANNGEPLDLHIVNDDGMKITASCWTDDESVLDSEASFTVTADWEITFHSPLTFTEETKIHDAIVAKVGGEWFYDAADTSFKQS